MSNDWDMAPSKPDARHRSGFFTLTREGPALKPEERQALAKAWVSPQDYKPRQPHKCGFNPDIALRFWRGTTWRPLGPDDELLRTLLPDEEA